MSRSVTYKDTNICNSELASTSVTDEQTLVLENRTLVPSKPWSKLHNYVSVRDFRPGVLVPRVKDKKSASVCTLFAGQQP